MMTVFRNSWALLLGTVMIMIAHGLSTSLIGVRGSIEGFDTIAIGMIMSGFFVGYMTSSMVTPHLVRRVGHVRVYAAYASMASACLILFAAAVDPILWALFRFLNGACMAGIYVVAESWLNGINANSRRGQALSLYLAAQLTGIVIGQGILSIGDPNGYDLFVVSTVLVSLAFGPVLLSASPVPVYETAKPLSFRELYHVSPLGFVGMLLLGAVFSIEFSMTAVYGVEKGLSVGEIAAMISAIYVGGTVVQYPMGWASDRIGRRAVVIGLTALSVAASLAALLLAGSLPVLLVLAGLIGAGTTPLYSVLIAHANDFLDNDRMAAGGARMVFLQGFGATLGPPIAGVVMGVAGSWSFFALIAIFSGALGLFATYRSTQRSAPAAEEAVAFAPMPLKTSGVGAEMYLEASKEGAVSTESERS